MHTLMETIGLLAYKKVKIRMKNDYIIVNYSTKEKNETFFVSEFEERHRKKTRFRFLKAVVSYLPLILKILI